MTDGGTLDAQLGIVGQALGLDALSRRAPAEASSSGSGYALRGRQGQVIAAMGQAIVGGRFMPGQLLPREAELMNEFGISRTSLREAIKVLAAKGLVETRQRVGTSVRPRDAWNVFDSELLAWHHAEGLDESIMRDLIELRQTLEPTAARLAAGRASMSDLRRIEQALSAMEQNQGDGAIYADKDVEFHLAVYGASHNSLLQRFGQLVADFLHLSFAVQQDVAIHEPADFTTDAAAHRRVYRAINEGAADTAHNAMLEVVLEGKAALINALEHRENRHEA